MLQETGADADPLHIDAPSPILFAALRRASYRRRLWLLAAGSLLFLLTVGTFKSIERAASPSSADAATPKAAEGDNLFALDFIAFYTAGRLVNEGRHRELFDLQAIKATQDALAAEAGADLGSAMGPWWNPPFYAWVFSPLARLPFGVATATWIAFNLLCATAACVLLVRMLPFGTSWRTWALVPVLMALSVPMIHAVTHGQNASTTLLIVTAAVSLWRSDKPMLAGLVAGLLAYKPQHAVVIGGILALCLGWRAVAGLAVTGFSLLLVTVVTLPGSVSDFLRQMPQNVRYVQERCPYLWERHATFKAFWRLIVQGSAIGPTSILVTVLTGLCMAAVAFLLLRQTPFVGQAVPAADPERRTGRIDLRMLRAFFRSAPAAGTACPTKIGRASQVAVRRPAAPEAPFADRRDRLIAASLLATPLLMPFYFDYDLLMLAVPAVLLAGLQIRTGSMTGHARFDAAIRVLGPIAYAWMLVNADIAEAMRVNLIVPLLAVLAAAVLLPRQPAAVAVEAEEEDPVRIDPPFARAA